MLKVQKNRLVGGLAEELRWQIIDGTLRPGDRLTEESISEQADVSRGTVRGAIAVLAAEGLAIEEPYKGATVANVSKDELAHVLIPVRWQLERYAAIDSIGGLTRDTVDQLESIVRAMKVQVESSEPGGDVLRSLVTLDIRFHRIVVDSARSIQTSQLWRAIQSRLCLGFHRLGLLQPHVGLIVEEHQRLLDSLRTQDPAEILRELSEHVLHSPLRLLSVEERDVHSGRHQ